mmetsp:Transcript_5630/g.14011  ORF Transcript_5630/g.14011 Transcript_5630/m.14011 type:complete len:248 (-) Transcript_5630:830-1573(-)
MRYKGRSQAAAAHIGKPQHNTHGGKLREVRGRDGARVCGRKRGRRDAHCAPDGHEGGEGGQQEASEEHLLQVGCGHAGLEPQPCPEGERALVAAGRGEDQRLRGRLRVGARLHDEVLVVKVQPLRLQRVRQQRAQALAHTLEQEAHCCQPASGHARPPVPAVRRVQGARQAEIEHFTRLGAAPQAAQHRLHQRNLTQLTQQAERLHRLQALRDGQQAHQVVAQACGRKRRLRHRSAATRAAGRERGQ